MGILVCQWVGVHHCKRFQSESQFCFSVRGYGGEFDGVEARLRDAEWWLDTTAVKRAAELDLI
jgi:hypothetical protein